MATPGSDDSSMKNWRLEEYKVLVQEFSSHYEHSQYSRSVMFTVNTVFLTAIGILLYSTRFGSWWAVVVIAFISVFTTLFNVGRLNGLKIYQIGNEVRESYLQEIEKDFPGNQPGESGRYKFGLYLRLRERGFGDKPGLMYRLVFLLFPYFYLVVTASVAMLTYLVIYGYIPKP